MTATPERQTVSGVDTLDSSQGKVAALVYCEAIARASICAQVVEAGGIARHKPVGVVFLQKHANCRSSALGMS